MMAGIYIFKAFEHNFAFLILRRISKEFKEEP
jgi:hypothetical protein